MPVQHAMKKKETGYLSEVNMSSKGVPLCRIGRMTGTPSGHVSDDEHEACITICSTEGMRTPGP